jgi:hypothetical protein
VLKHRIIKTYGEVEVELHAFFISALDGCQSPPGSSVDFLPQETSSCIHFIGGLVVTKADLCAVARRIIFATAGNRIPYSAILLCSPFEIHSTSNEVCILTIILVGKPEGKRPLGRNRRRWEDNIRMDLREIRWEGVDWMHLSHIGASGGLL